VFWRFRANYFFSPNHSLGLLLAPLSLTAQGVLPGPVHFAGSFFPAQTQVEALYKFNSYRLTYSYRWWSSANLELWAGITTKIRDAEIRLTSDTQMANKTDLGFVPLVYLGGEWRFSRPWSFIFNADALVAPQGRAEDVLLAVAYRADEAWHIHTGYRFVEGGGDNKAVYSFAMIHYAVLGMHADF
jgi:hypothetical protein